MAHYALGIGADLYGKSVRYLTKEHQTMNFAIFLISGWFNRRIEEVMTKKKDATSHHLSYY